MTGLLEQLVNGSPFGIVVFDNERRLQILNTAAKRVITTVGNPMGLAIEAAIPMTELHQLVPVQDALDAKKVEFEYGTRFLKAQSTPLYNVDTDCLEGRLIIVEDVTQAKRLERAQRDFVANVSHELRTPTTSIAGFAQMMLDDRDQLSEEHKMMLEAIHRNALRLNNLFEDLLILSKVEADNGPLPMDTVFLNGVVQECVDKQKVRASKKNIEFLVLVSDKLKVRSNRDALLHIVGNFVENAVKYSFENQLVTVRAALRDGSVQLEVIDLGEGISPSDQKKIFERFFRVDKSRSRAVGGTGLGLAIVRTLLNRTGIRLELRSQVGKGSIFRIYLPPDEGLSERESRR